MTLDEYRSKMAALQSSVATYTPEEARRAAEGVPPIPTLTDTQPIPGRYDLDPKTGEPINRKYYLTPPHRPCRRCGSHFRYRSTRGCVNCQSLLSSDKYRESVAARVRATGTIQANPHKRPARLAPDKTQRQIDKMFADFKTDRARPKPERSTTEGDGYYEYAVGGRKGRDRD